MFTWSRMTLCCGCSGTPQRVQCRISVWNISSNGLQWIMLAASSRYIFFFLHVIKRARCKCFSRNVTEMFYCRTIITQWWRLCNSLLVLLVLLVLRAEGNTWENWESVTHQSCRRAWHAPCQGIHTSEIRSDACVFFVQWFYVCILRQTRLYHLKSI